MSIIYENDNIGDFISSKVKAYDNSLNPQNKKQRKYFNYDFNVIKMLRKRKFDKAAAYILNNKINAFSLFNNVEIFDNVYNNIPFVAVALGIAVDKTKDINKMVENIAEMIDNVFIPTHINAANMFDAKFSSNNGSMDVLSFVLTHDKQIKHSKYDEYTDMAITALISQLLTNGYQFINNKGILKYIIDNDMICALRLLIENGIYTPSINDMKLYNISSVSNIGRFIDLIAEHPFKIHAPEIERDDKGKFAGGDLYRMMMNVNYDISKVDKVQKVHISVAWMLRDTILNIYTKYLNNGEKFTNIEDINFGDGSEFKEAENRLLYLCSEYYKFIKSRDIDNIDVKNKKVYYQELVNSVHVYVQHLTDGLNRILKNIDLPEVELIIQNDVKENDSKLIYKIVTFMKELWNSVKLSSNNRR